MSKPDDQRVHTILESDAAAAWQAQLITAFFDAEARRELIASIREAVAVLAPEVNAEELEELRRAVIRHLIGMASQQPKPPAQEPDAGSQVEVLTVTELEDRGITSYPYPIA